MDDLENKLLEALAEEPVEMTAADWEELRRRVSEVGRLRTAEGSDEAGF